MDNLRKFNLVNNGYSVTVQTVRKDNDDYCFKVVIFNFDEKVAFILPNELTCDAAEVLAEKVFNTNIVNLTLWDTGENWLATNQKSDIIDGFIDVYTHYPLHAVNSSELPL
tara:strand:+ start:114 stop:446 length:333 start_codon:yes stop_codon:yes gene_type:complete